MNHLEMLVGLWVKVGLIIFLAAIATIVALLVAASPWLNLNRSGYCLDDPY